MGTIKMHQWANVLKGATGHSSSMNFTVQMNTVSPIRQVYKKETTTSNELLAVQYRRRCKACRSPVDPSCVCTSLLDNRPHRTEMEYLHNCNRLSDYVAKWKSLKIHHTNSFANILDIRIHKHNCTVPLSAINRLYQKQMDKEIV